MHYLASTHKVVKSFQIVLSIPLVSTGHENADALQKRIAMLVGDFVWNDWYICVSIGIFCKAVNNISSSHSIWKSNLNLLSCSKIIKCSKYYSIVKLKKYCRQPAAWLLWCELTVRPGKNSNSLISTVKQVDPWSTQEQIAACNLQL